MNTVYKHTILVSDYKMLDPGFSVVTTFIDNLSIQLLGTLELVILIEVTLIDMKRRRRQRDASAFLCFTQPFCLKFVR